MTPADAILAVLADEYDRNPAFRESVLSDLASPAHAAEADSPAESGITARALLLPSLDSRPGPIRGAGSRVGAR